MVADDDRLTREILAETLRAHGFTVEAVRAQRLGQDFAREPIIVRHHDGGAFELLRADWLGARGIAIRHGPSG